MMRIKKILCTSLILVLYCFLPLSGFAERRPASEEYRSLEAMAAGAFDKVDPSRIELEYDSEKSLYQFLMSKWENEPDRLEWLIEHKQDYTEGKGFYRILLDGEEVGGFEPPVRMEIVVAARSHFDMKNGDFKYDYVLHGKKRNLQDLGGFVPQVDQRKVPVLDVAEPSKWMHDWNDDFAKSTPKRSYWRFWSRPYAEWKKGEIPPSESIEGFSIRSPGLPAILECQILVWRKNPVTYLTMKHHTHSSVQEGCRILTGKTIGPVAPPEEFDPGQFVGELALMIDQSLTEGWVEDKNVAQDLRNRLGSARQAAETEDQRRLKSTLVELLSKVEKEKDRSLLSEAYALIKYNVQYWLDQLK
ncbi:MAG: hypothetical protein ACE5JA_06855 [bacterium]